MLTHQDLNKLIENLKQIIEICAEYGLSNLRLFKPIIPDDINKFNFFVSTPIKAISLFTKADIEQRMSEILNQQTVLITEKQIRVDMQDCIFSNCIECREDNMNNIRTFFNENLLEKITDGQSATLFRAPLGKKDGQTSSIILSCSRD